MPNDNIFAEERKKRIVEYINIHSKATVSELCGYFHVSQATIRNDLRALASDKLISKVHGGAIANHEVIPEQEKGTSQLLQASEKKAIANAALKYIHEGDAIGLDTGTSAFELATRLGIFHDLTVVTYDLSIAFWLTQNTNVHVILTGGAIHKSSRCITGISAIQTIQNLQLDASFIGAQGIHTAKGLTTPKVDTADIKRLLITNSRKVILMADSQKLGNISFVKFGNISDIDYFITDYDAPQEDIVHFENENVKVELVSSDA